MVLPSLLAENKHRHSYGITSHGAPTLTGQIVGDPLGISAADWALFPDRQGEEHQFNDMVVQQHGRFLSSLGFD